MFNLVGRLFSGRLPDDLAQRVLNKTELYTKEQSVWTMVRMATLHSHNVQIWTDNTTTMFYVNKGGWRPFLSTVKVSLTAMGHLCSTRVGTVSGAST